jgi:hypothetical protein
MVRAYCKTHGLPEPDRHELHREALGEDKSSKAFTNRDLDLVLAEFRGVYDPDNLAPQMGPAEQRRRRMLWLIRNQKLTELARALFPETDDEGAEGERLTAAAKVIRAKQYIGAIMKNKFKVLDLEDLTEGQLQLLVVDITRATAQLRKKTTADNPF